MVTVMCWLVIHTSYDALDNRREIKVKGHIVREAGDNLIVNFYEGFKINKIDSEINPVEQMVNENSCLYE